MSALPPLLEQLNHADHRTRLRAIKALRNFEPDDVLPALMRLLEDDSVAVVRAATVSIGHLGGCEHIDVLLPLLEHPSLWVRKGAVQALGIAGCAEVVPVLVNLLGDADLDGLSREALVALKVDPDFF